MTVTIGTEAAVLSSCLSRLDQGWYGHVRRVGGDDAEELFSDHKHRAVFSAIAHSVESGKLVTVSQVADRLARTKAVADPDDYLFSLQATPPLPSVEHLDDALDELREARAIRRQVRSMEEVLADIADPELDARPEDVAVRLRDIIDSTEVTSTIKTFGEITSEILSSARPMWAQSTGIESLDEVLGGRGLESGCLTVIAARPKVGKTILMNTLIHNCLDGGAVPLVLNYETKKVEFVAKMIARYVADPTLNWGIVKGFLAKEHEAEDYDGPGISATHQAEILDGIAWAERQPWYVSFDKTMSMHDIYSLVAKTKADNPEGSKIVLFVDYLQLQVMDSYHEYEEISQLTKFYKRLAGEFDVSCCVLSQLNRDAKGGKVSAHQMRGSGSIEQDADTILLLDRPSRREDDAPRHILELYAGTTRLAEGGNYELFIDGATNIVTDMPEDMKSDSSEFVEDIV